LGRGKRYSPHTHVEFQKAVIYLPREALNAKTPPDVRGGVLRIYLNQTVVELVEAPLEVVATYSYLKPDEAKAPKARAEWIRPPTRKPLDKEGRQSSSHQPLGKEGESLHQTSTQSTTVVLPSGAFIYRQYTGWINADDEVCLNVLMPDAYIILDNPTVASVGYNATYVWRSAWYVYTSGYRPRRRSWGGGCEGVGRGSDVIRQEESAGAVGCGFEKWIRHIHNLLFSQLA
jgi:hypothetical protein